MLSRTVLTNGCTTICSSFHLSSLCFSLFKLIMKLNTAIKYNIAHFMATYNIFYQMLSILEPACVSSSVKRQGGKKITRRMNIQGVTLES